MAVINRETLMPVGVVAAIILFLFTAFFGIVGMVGGAAWWLSAMYETQVQIVADVAEIKENQDDFVTEEKHATLIALVQSLDRRVIDIENSRFTLQDAEAIMLQHVIQYHQGDKPAKESP